jgi:hypothetical protein
MGVLCILSRSIKINAPDAILHIELILKAVWNGLGISHDQQIVGDVFRIGRAGASAVTSEKVLLRLTWAITIGPDILFIVGLFLLRRLLLTVSEKLA